MNRIALVGIIIEDLSQAARVNELLHSVCDYIAGRMGLPYKDRGVNIISVVIDAPQEVISALGGKLGALSGVSTKVLYTQVGV